MLLHFKVTFLKSSHLFQQFSRKSASYSDGISSISIVFTSFSNYPKCEMTEQGACLFRHYFLIMLSNEVYNIELKTIEKHSTVHLQAAQTKSSSATVVYFNRWSVETLLGLTSTEYQLPQYTIAFCLSKRCEVWFKCWSLFDSSIPLTSAKISGNVAINARLELPTGLSKRANNHIAYI